MLAQTDPQGEFNVAVLLFVGTVSVLLIALVSVTLVALGRRLRRLRQRRRQADAAGLPDAWTEAANRVQPFERRERDG